MRGGGAKMSFEALLRYTAKRCCNLRGVGGGSSSVSCLVCLSVVCFVVIYDTSLVRVRVVENDSGKRTCFVCVWFFFLGIQSPLFLYILLLLLWYVLCYLGGLLVGGGGPKVTGKASG
jgi:hypothetical protein